MRLLKSSSVELEYFSSNKFIPDYAILSHTWEAAEEEVLFADMEKSTAAGKAGYKKLLYSCKQAMADGFDYVWIDTCCTIQSHHR
jgi:Heterokaryon incompatibility protein (HET)